MKLAANKAPEVYFSFYIEASAIDREIIAVLQNLFCSIDIPLRPAFKNGKLLFDKKFYAGKANLLNEAGIVFGFHLTYAEIEGDNLKAFMDRLDFAVNQYPNHIDFPQLEASLLPQQDGKISSIKMPKPSATFSTQDIKNCRETAFALSTFYTYGRAVTWFLAVLAPLKMSASKFFQDFAEWQKINNCSLESPWKAEKASHAEIEKMQLSFLKFKYEEKNKSELFEVVSNVVRLNGALSRAFGEGEESEVELSYNPDELLSGSAMDIQAFFDNSFIENSTVKVFMGEDGPDYHYC